MVPKKASWFDGECKSRFPFTAFHLPQKFRLCRYVQKYVSVELLLGEIKVGFRRLSEREGLGEGERRDGRGRNGRGGETGRGEQKQEAAYPSRKGNFGFHTLPFAAVGERQR